jgi:Amyotrophic lateral sclerosis 2 chromosomal region candidate gene 8
LNKHRIFFEEPKKVGLLGLAIPYDGFPFLIESTVFMDCQFGRDHHAAHKKKVAKQKKVFMFHS